MAEIVASRKIGNFTIEVTSCVAILTQKEIDDICASASDVSDRIIACVQHGEDNKVVFVTADCATHSFDIEKTLVPRGSFLPVEDGKKVFLPNEGRWPPQIIGFFPTSRWLLSQCDPMMNNGKIFVDNRYVCDIDAEKITMVHT